MVRVVFTEFLTVGLHQLIQVAEKVTAALRPVLPASSTSRRTNL
jgi:hypothetical protein